MQGHGGDIYVYDNYSEILDFSSNINPFGPSEAVGEAVKKASCEIGRYPDGQCRGLTRAISEKFQLPEDQIIIGNGAADLLFSLVFAERPKRALLVAPSFVEYEQALRAVECKIEYAYLYTINDFCLTDTYLEQLNEQLDMIFLCSPNNPTGKMISRRLLEKILEKSEEYQIRMVVDECFYEFLEEPEKATMQSFIEEHPQLFILRAFTKMHAMPGLRLGYGFCSDRNLLDRMQNVRQTWSVSGIAQEAGIVALQDEERVAVTRDYISKERTRMEEKLRSFGVNYVPSDANYILFYIEESEGEERLFDRLLEQGILIRDCQNYVGLKKGYYRIAIKREEENNRLLDALQYEIQKMGRK